MTDTDIVDTTDTNIELRPKWNGWYFYMVINYDSKNLQLR